MQEIGEQLDSAILSHAILLQLMYCSIASCVLHIACRMLRWCKIPLKCVRKFGSALGGEVTCVCINIADS